MWGLFISQGCLVYTGYLYTSWLPNYLQSARHLSILNSGIYTAIPFVISTVVGVVANWAGDRVLSAEAVRRGSRRYLVALSLLFVAAGLGIPFCPVTRRRHHCDHHCGIGRPCRAGRQRRPGRRFVALAQRCRAGYRFPCPGRQYLRPTGTDCDRLRRCRNWQFQRRLRRRRCAGAVGAVAAVALVRGTLGEHVRPPRASPRLASWGS